MDEYATKPISQSVLNGVISHFMHNSGGGGAVQVSQFTTIITIVVVVFIVDTHTYIYIVVIIAIIIIFIVVVIIVVVTVITIVVTIITIIVAIIIVNYSVNRICEYKIFSQKGYSKCQLFGPQRIFQCKRSHKDIPVQNIQSKGYFSTNYSVNEDSPVRIIQSVRIFQLATVTH
jgi:hypothetical protein